MLIDTAWLQNTTSALIGTIVGAAIAFVLQNRRDKERQKAIGAAIAWELSRIQDTLFHIRFFLRFPNYSDERKTTTLAIDKLELKSETKRIYENSLLEICQLSPEMQNSIFSLYESIKHINVNADGLIEMFSNITNKKTGADEDDIRWFLVSWNLYVENLEKTILLIDDYLKKFGSNVKREPYRIQMQSMIKEKFGDLSISVDNHIEKLKSQGFFKNKT